MAAVIKSLGAHKKMWCKYCKRHLTHPKDKSRTAATRDHVRPKSRGGRKTVPCCRQCNQLKGDWSLDDWQTVMAAYPEWWKKFDNRGELLRRISVDLSYHRQRKEHQRVRSLQAWPKSIQIPRSPISGLNYRAAA